MQANVPVGSLRALPAIESEPSFEHTTAFSRSASEHKKLV
jgi:hypothetical protein